MIEKQLNIYCDLFYRNHGMGDTSIKFEVIPGKNQKSEYVMTCGKHTVRGWCEYPCLRDFIQSISHCHTSEMINVGPLCRLISSHITNTAHVDRR